MSGDEDDLFGWQTRVRRTDPWTSDVAAQKSTHSASPKHNKVKEIHRAHRKGLTDWELEEICGDHGATYRTRRQELSSPKWFNPPPILNSGRTKCNLESDHPHNERIIWIWHEYAEPYLTAPIPETPVQPPPTNAFYDSAGRLIHDRCAKCGASNTSFGVGVLLRKGQLGMWYCMECEKGEG